MKKTQPKKIRKVTKTNLKVYSRKYQQLFLYGSLSLFSLFFLGVSTVVEKPLSMLPQTGEGSSQNIGDIFYTFVYSTPGKVVLIVSWILYMVLVFYLFGVKYRRNKTVGYLSSKKK